MEFNENQKKAINFKDGNAVVIASAGSGKTTVLTNRIKNLITKHNVDPDSILAVTFSKKTKETLIDKLDKLLSSHGNDVRVETFHSFALKIIHSAYGNCYKVWTARWEKEKIIKDILMAMDLYKDDNSIPYSDILNYFALQKRNMLKPSDELIYFESTPYNEKEMHDIYSLYEEYKEKTKLIEFDDFLNMAIDIFDTNKSILKNYQDSIRYVMADEYQDVSVSQAKLLQKLNRDNTMVVGDPLQAIYSFRGGDSKFILDFDRDYDNVTVINLNTNYRCSSDIVGTANTFAKAIPDSNHRNYIESIAENSNIRKPELTRYTSAYEEGDGVSERISELKKQKKYSYSDFAILARTNAQLQKIENCLCNHDIPFHVVDGNMFAELPEIKLLISYLRLVFNHDDNEAFRYIYNKPNRWLSKKFLEETELNAKKCSCSLYESMFTIKRRLWRFKTGIDEIAEITQYLSNEKIQNIGDMISYLRKRLDIDAFILKNNHNDEDEFDGQIENMNSFQDMCREYNSIDEFISGIDKLNEQYSKNISDKVHLLTIHKSKGLEFPVVFLIGCNDGLLPHIKNDNIDDERRLMYVATTRAEKELYLSYTQFYNNKTVNISPFINELEDTIIRNDKKLRKEVS